MPLLTTKRLLVSIVLTIPLAAVYLLRTAANPTPTLNEDRESGGAAKRNGEGRSVNWKGPMEPWWP